VSALPTAPTNAAAAPAQGAALPGKGRARAIARRSGELVGLDRLTPREQDVARGMGAGQTNKQIARALGIEPGTVKSYVRRVLSRLGVKRKDVGLLIASEVVG
jgi:DNA-binding NarL/FixJ family response regulator